MIDPGAVRRLASAGSTSVRVLRTVQLFASTSAALSILSAGVALGRGSYGIPTPGSGRAVQAWASDSLIAAVAILRIGLMFGAAYWLALIVTGLAIRLLRVSTMQAAADRVTPGPVRRMIDDILSC